MRANFDEVVSDRSPDASLLDAIDWARLPAHVAIIMDGNGRWAKLRHQPRIAGHKAGVDAVQAAVETGVRLGLRALTLYAFSTENWKRPRAEVQALMRMLRYYLREELASLHEKGIRFQAIGRLDGLDAKVQAELERAMQLTSENTGMVLSVALNYGGRAELVDACKGAARELLAQQLGPDAITEELIGRHLYTSQLPELDLLVRTSGEMRISNFLLWQNAYSEIYVTETLWPDFRRQHLLAAVLEFQRRDRRFGGVKVQANGKR